LAFALASWSAVASEARHRFRTALVLEHEIAPFDVMLFSESGVTATALQDASEFSHVFSRMFLRELRTSTLKGGHQASTVIVTVSQVVGRTQALHLEPQEKPIMTVGLLMLNFEFQKKPGITKVLKEQSLWGDDTPATGRIYRSWQGVAPATRKFDVRKRRASFLCLG
jgi:hypothetical protein